MLQFPFFISIIWTSTLCLTTIATYTMVVKETPRFELERGGEVGFG